MKTARWPWIVAVVLVGVVALGLVLTRVTASASVCGLCHEMAPEVAAWRTSGHTKIACPSCHEKPRPWYRFPETLAIRGAMLGRDISLHVLDRRLPSVPATTTVPDSACRRCHDPSRKVTLRLGTLIDHTGHARRNNSCLSCHLYTAHPLPNAEKPILMMELCFNCHGRQPRAKAPGTCSTCHPAFFSLIPQSHEPKEWLKTHGTWAMGKRQPCEMCHETSYCEDCHGLQMPHPVDWAKGTPNRHSLVAAKDRTVCARCHPEKPDLCGMCHHQSWEPKKGPWIKQHQEMVRQRGASFCMQCHQATYCYDCHESRNVKRTPDMP